MASIIRQSTVIRDGQHNAFTSLEQWREQYWLTYRKSVAHTYRPDGRAIIANSVDRHTFNETACLKTPHDNRDPLLAVMSPDRLAVLLPDGRRVGNEYMHSQYISFTADGYHWEQPQFILDDRYHIFNVRFHQGLWYAMTCWRITPTDGSPRQRKLFLMTSSDLINWTQIAQIGTDDQLLNEADIVFRPDGTAWIIARSLRQPDHSFFCAAQAPYTDWTVTDLGIRIHCPQFITHQGKSFVSGRCNPPELGESGWPFGSSLAVWEVTHAAVKLVLRIPAIGDCAYPGFIEDSEGRVCISYYSQHAYYMGVVPPYAGKTVASDHPDTPDSYAADIFFAELDLSSTP